MNYKGKKIAITGHTGFLGTALAKELEDMGAMVWRLGGDVRDPQTFGLLDYSFDYLFHLAAPSSQILFQREPDYAIDVTINGFRNAIKACEKNGIKLIYPSTGLLSHDGTNEYARAKKICEDLQAGAKCDSLGLRIFGTYGPQEAQKRDFASVPYLFAKDLVEGRAPVIYGDGTQERDFIYIDDTIQAILHVAEAKSGGTIDIGSGQPISFNDLVKLITIAIDKPVKPSEYTGTPKDYIDSTGAAITELKRYYTPQVSMAEGLKRVVEAIRG